MIADMHRNRDAGGTGIDESLAGDLPWHRPAVLVALAVILVGTFAAGLLVAGLPPGDDSPEAGFARDMGIHHSQAVEMAEIARDRTNDAEVRILAVDIALGQQAQIGQMQGWLAIWGLPATGTQPAMAWMGHILADGTSMPGMATIDDLKLLRDVPPDKVDAMFLQLMISHHRGGVLMAEGVLSRTRRPEVRRLAQAIVNGQVAEIKAMTELLDRKGASAPSAAPTGTSMAMAGHTMGPGLIVVRASTFLDLPPYALIALATFAAAWLLIDVAPRTRSRMAALPVDRRHSEGVYALAVGGLALGASLHLGLWPTYTLGQAGTSLLFSAVSIGMAAAGGAILAWPSSRSCAAGAGVAMLATSMFVVLRLVPAVAGTTPLPLDGLELVALGVDLIALLCCAVLWLSEPDRPVRPGADNLVGTR